MLTFALAGATGVAVLLLVPVMVLSVEIVSAFFARKPVSTAMRPANFHLCTGVLVPAHNESTGLRQTIESIRPQLKTDDRLLVVADNCTDDTAEIASALGAEVIVRDDVSRRGKGYALDFGIKHFAKNPPDVVIVVDADCYVTPKSVVELSLTAHESSRPVQAMYLMKAPEQLSERFQLSELFWRIKNWVRPLGLYSLGLPCQLMGSGMAFPWEVIRRANLASDEIVEDIKLGLDLARAGTPPLFCPRAGIISYFPSSSVGASSQRRRWETGHLRLIVEATPRLLWEGLARSSTLVLALDLAVPPLSLLVLMLVFMLMVSSAIFIAGLSAVPLSLILFELIVLACVMILAWSKFCRDLLSLQKLMILPFHILGKLRFYSGILFSARTSRAWIRTDRSDPSRTKEPENSR